MYGFEGSTAHIDSYSGVVFIINLFLNKSADRYLFSIFSFLIMLWTTRMTPIVATVLSIPMFFIVRRKITGLLFIILPMIFFMWLIYALVYKDYYVSYGGLPPLPLKAIAGYLTHSRAYFWEQQMNYLLNNYTFKDYLFGRFDDNFVFRVFIGDYREGINPHNTYLYLFYRSPLLFILFYSLMLYYIFKTFDRRTYPVIFLILVSAYTNFSIIGIYNPIFIYVLLFMIVKYNKS